MFAALLKVWFNSRKTEILIEILKPCKSAHIFIKIVKKLWTSRQWRTGQKWPRQPHVSAVHHKQFFIRNQSLMWA